MPGQRFTVYDVLEAKGEFRKNPANRDAATETGEPLYVGPVMYPRMMYHPTGEERVTVQAYTIDTPYGPKQVGEQREIVNVLVMNEQEEKHYVSQGWHMHPAASLRAAGRAAPPAGPQETIDSLRKQIEELMEKQKMLESQKSVPSAGPGDSLQIANPTASSTVNPLSKPAGPRL